MSTLSLFVFAFLSEMVAAKTTGLVVLLVVIEEWASIAVFDGRNALARFMGEKSRRMETFHRTQIKRGITEMKLL